MTEPRGLRAAGAATLALEGLAILFAFPVVRLLGGGLTPTRIAVLVGLPVLLFGAAGLLRWRGGWWAGSALQVAVVAAGMLTLALGVLGVAFAAVWAYVLHLRRTLAAR